MMNDTLSDMLVRIRNAAMVGKATVAVPMSKLNERVAQILKDEGYLDGFQVVGDGAIKTLNLTLRYFGERRSRKPTVTGLKRISKPGKRVYSRSDSLKPILNGLGISILSTSKGVISDREARTQKLGGEILCELW